jgi:hypothetical protein
MRFFSSSLRIVPFAVLGAVPGLIWYTQEPSIPPILVTCLGAFVAGALSHPKVSATNVLVGGVGAVAAYNAPGFIRTQILDATFGESRPSNPEELIGKILEYADAHGVESLPSAAKQIALIAWAESAADSESLHDYLSNLPQGQLLVLKNAYDRLGAIDIASSLEEFIACGSSAKLQYHVQDRKGYDLSSLCRLLGGAEDQPNC